MPKQLSLIAPEPEPGASGRDHTASAAYRARLRARLSDPAFRAIEGFPIGDDETILALSDPPFYTACPNPFLPEIIEQWQAERQTMRTHLGLPDDTANGYTRDPFATDVSEGKNDPIYNAHSYHTKVPHKAIMRYILHYTDPGDIVFDGFCGTGMTGVAAQLCGDRRAVESLGFRVDADGTVYDGQTPVSRLGTRKAVLVDLSPAATFIAYNYNTPVDVAAFEREARRILDEVETECGWMYETWHPHCDHPQRVKGRINFTVWSEVFACPNCTGEITFLDEALDAETLRVRDEFACPHCSALLNKRSLERVRMAFFDPLLNQLANSLKRRPVSIEYTVGRTKHTKAVDREDLRLLERIRQMPPAQGTPIVALPIARMSHGSRLAPKGVDHVHQLFLPRSSHALALLWHKADAVDDLRLRAFVRFTAEQAIWGMSLLNRYGPTHFSQVNRYLSGVYYISSLISEVSPRYILEGKSERIVRAFTGLRVSPRGVVVATQSTAVTCPKENSIDYIFTDPPFGENIYYADLNFLVESWHGVHTDSGPEAIVDQAKHKTLRDYGELMRRAFVAYFRWLKPGRWMTVEFHNSHNAVWNAIQEALMAAGFVVADVRTLDKQQRSYRQVTASTATKQDLVISAYKPAAAFEQQFQSQAGSEAGAWAFVDEHLHHLPVPQLADGRLEVLVERQAYLLFDRMVAFHIQRGLTVPLGAAGFYAGLRQRYSERDGMYFLPLQASAYDRLRLQAAQVEQLPLLVTDERSAILWLRRELGERPLTYQDLQPRFLRELHQAGHEQLPELRAILEENFLPDEAGRWYVPDPGHAQDLEKLRERSLLREFRTYLESRGRLKVFRGEAVRAGFRDAWRRRDYATIVTVAQRLPERVVQEDADLLMYYDNALMRSEKA